MGSWLHRGVGKLQGVVGLKGVGELYGIGFLGEVGQPDAVPFALCA